MLGLHNIFFNRIARMTKETDMNVAQINLNTDGSAYLTDRLGRVIATYSRSRDAVRGAKRRGLTIA